MKTEETLIRVLQKQFILKIDDTYGSEAIDDFKFCVSQLKKLYKAIDISQYESIMAYVGNYAEYQDYDPPAHAPVLNIPRTYTFSIPAAEVNPGWWELFMSDNTDEPEPEPDPEPCTETELTDFLGI